MIQFSLNAQHSAPEAIKEEAGIALSFYPQLAEVPIEFKFKKNIRKSTMLAQPHFWSLFRPKGKRKYMVLIGEKIQISDREFATADIPKDILIGWLGHELGHIMDYCNRSSFNLFWFGLKYTLSDRYLMTAERAADSFAVDHGMESYILKTKDFILNNADISENYKKKISKYYLSPKEIMVLIEERENQKESGAVE
jgi:hypothetical protein